MLALCIAIFCIGTLFLKQRHTLLENYNRFLELQCAIKDTLPVNERTNLRIFLDSSKTVLKMWWIQFLHWINSTVEHIDHHTAIVSYTLDGKLYKLAVKRKKGPHRILLITDENHDDVTNLILPYYGPYRDWHNLDYKPSFWKKEQLNFQLSSGEILHFYQDEHIII